MVARTDSVEVPSSVENSTPVEQEQPEMTTEKKTALMQESFLDGKRDYIAGRFDSAADKLGQATALCVEIYGEFATESFDAHLYYGKSLLELGRAEEDVIKTAMKDMPISDENNESIDEEKYGNPETLTETEREDIREKVEEALEENAKELEAKTDESAAEKTTSEAGTTEAMDTSASAEEEKANESTATAIESESPEKKVEETGSQSTTEEEAKTEITKVEETKTDEGKVDDSTSKVEEDASKTAETETVEEKKTEEAVVDTKADSTEETTTETAATEEGEEAEKEGDEEEEGSESAEEPSSIQAAWEVLEVARSICDKQEANKEWDLKKADVLLTLGECSIEDENYKQAVDDLTVCIELYQKHLEAFDRAIAQAYVTMARAYKLNDDFDISGLFYTKAKETIVAKIANLEGSIEKSEEKEKVQQEIDELKELVPDLDLKIEDSKDSAKQTEENMNKIRQEIGLSTAPAAATLTEKTDAPAQDISSLVRKPVKRVAESTEEDEAVKRAKAEETTTTA